MSGELATTTAIRQPAQLMQSIEKYLESMGNKLSQKHRTQFVEIASAFQLNPFIREIYGIPYGDNFSIIVGYEVYLKRAETSGQLAGWRAWTEGEVKFEQVKKTVNKKDGGTFEKTVTVPRGNLKGCVEIKRKDWDSPFYHEVYLDEYSQDNEMWGSKPRTMIKKVAIAQGFRMAFPVELGGIPYTADELPDPTPVNDPAPRQLHSVKPVVEPPKEKAAEQTAGAVKLVSEAQAKMLYAKLKNKGVTPESFCAHYKIEKVQDLPFSEMNSALKLIDSGEIAEVAATEPAEKLPSLCADCGQELKEGVCTNEECGPY